MHSALSPTGIWKLRIRQKWHPLPPFYWAWLVSGEKYLTATLRQSHFLSYIWYELNIYSWKTWSIAQFIFAAWPNIAPPDQLAYTPLVVREWIRRPGEPLQHVFEDIFLGDILVGFLYSPFGQYAQQYSDLLLTPPASDLSSVSKKAIFLWYIQILIAIINPNYDLRTMKL